MTASAMVKPMVSRVAGTPELVVNGGFDADTAWTKGANWTISGGVAAKTAGATNNLAHQTLTAQAGRTYRVQFTISGYGGLGSLTASFGGVSGTPRTGNGTYVEYITAANSGALILIGGTSFAGNVDEVSVQIAGPKP